MTFDEGVVVHRVVSLPFVKRDASRLAVLTLTRKADIRLHGKGNSKLPWRKAGQPSHLVDVLDSDQ